MPDPHTKSASNCGSQAERSGSRRGTPARSHRRQRPSGDPASLIRGYLLAGSGVWCRPHLNALHASVEQASCLSARRDWAPAGSNGICTTASSSILVTLSLMLRGIRDRAPADVRADVDEVCDGLAGTREELRDLSRGLHLAILVEAGLGPAVRALARRSPLPVRVQVRADGGLPGSCEATAYYVAAEAFANVAKHAAASGVDILIERADGALTVQFRDDGVGGVGAARGSGLVGLRDRVEAVGGTMTLDSPARAGTIMTVRLPVTAEDHSAERTVVHLPRDASQRGNGS